MNYIFLVLLLLNFTAFCAQKDQSSEDRIVRINDFIEDIDKRFEKFRSEEYKMLIYEQNRAILLNQIFIIKELEEIKKALGKSPAMPGPAANKELNTDEN